MRLVRYDPFAGLTSLHSQLDDVFGNLFSSPATQAGTSMPAIDVYNEDDKQLIAEVQAPGFKKEDIEINIHEGVLEIRGQHKEKVEDKDKKRSYMVRESQASFYRRIALPKNADNKNVQASFSNGVLKVSVPFKELPAPQKIAIQSGTTSKKS